MAALLLAKLFYFVVATSIKYNIDESHGLRHSMDVLRFSTEIFEKEVLINTWLRDHERIIHTAAIVHDMCDKKYVNEKEGVQQIEEFLQNKLDPVEIDVIKKIITTMSYSKVKVSGFPEMGKYELAYHIVREADLLAAYDFERCMVYCISQQNGDIVAAFKSANELFHNRVLRHEQDGLFITEYSKIKSRELHAEALDRIAVWKNIISNTVFKL